MIEARAPILEPGACARGACRRGPHVAAVGREGQQAGLFDRETGLCRGRLERNAIHVDVGLLEFLVGIARKRGGGAQAALAYRFLHGSLAFPDEGVLGKTGLVGTQGPQRLGAQLAAAQLQLQAGLDARRRSLITDRAQDAGEI